MHEALVSVTLRAPGEAVRISVTDLGSDSPLIGAAELAFAPLIADPLAAVFHHAS